MASVTSLELLNRVRLFRRQPTTTVIDTPEDTVTLNAINMAIEDVLSTKRWEFDLRHDGQLALKGRVDGATLQTTAGSTAATVRLLAGLTDAHVFGDYVVRVFLDGNADYGNTAFRIEKSGSAIAATASSVVLNVVFPDTLPATDAELHYSEYILPDTVGEIVRATYQEESLEVRQVDPVVRYTELFPNPNESTGPPEVVAIGGFDIKTYFSGGGTPAPALRLAVWPIPDEDYVINYSYYYRHPELLGASAALVGVPTSVVNDIVLQATSTVMMTWDQNYAASHFTDLSRQQAAAKHLAYGGSKARRRTIGSFERGRGSAHVELGFPHKLIGQ
jgi:hypothetical protein